MAVYVVFGKLGTGKTKFCVWRAQQALREGLRVASNVDLNLGALTPERASRYIRIPDKPDSAALDAMGHGNPETYDEDRNGLLILDELGTWLNARSFQDKSRAGVIDWLIHARKLGWSVLLIVQDPGMVDKQVREALVEYEVRCMRMDKVKVPVVGGLLMAIGGCIGFPKLGYLPRFHLATARIGFGQAAIVAERWSYRGDDLHAAYDTRQRFLTDYPHGTHTVLPAWDFKAPPRLRERLRAFVAGKVGASGVAAGMRSSPPLRPKHPAVAAIQRHLEPHDRVRHVQRLLRLGLLDIGG